MTRTRQQVSRASAAVSEQTHNGWHSVIDEIDEQVKRLSNVEHNVDTMRATMERAEAMMMHMAQSLQTQPLQQPIQQQNQQVWHEDLRSSYVNRGTHQRRERSLQGLVSMRTKRNEATSRQQSTGVEPRARTACSHFPESNRNKRCSEVVRTENNQGRSTTGNVFNILGRGADMRKTLNRRREQERSQHSIT